ncbi:hypothetical protein FFLO_05597 [Filobasidium floriforme]|uniref:Uncharacterized protein n=1 Tax=Filobasidium floriforme TaxID=5210 RepID=A0A8K0NR87_9TREE|nr:hypothetical protein FFLO_05597 [Filobasidium floriforme]
MHHYLSGLVRRFWRRAPSRSLVVDNDKDEHTLETTSHIAADDGPAHAPIAFDTPTYKPPSSIPSSLNSPAGKSSISQGSDQGSPATHTALVRMAEDPADLFWTNDLIMSEVYAHIEYKRDLLSCLLASKDNFGRVAKHLYRDLSKASIHRMIDLGCPYERLEPVFRAVKAIEIEDYDIPSITDGSILDQFPNVGYISIRHDNYYMDATAITVTRYIVSGVKIWIEREFRPDWDDLSWFGLDLKGASSSALVEITITPGNCTCDATDLVAELVNHAQTVFDGKTNGDQRFGSLEVLGLPRSVPITDSDLRLLTSLCPELLELSVALVDNGPVHRGSAVLSHLSEKLEDVSIINADLGWLPSLKSCKKIYLECNTAPSAEWMLEEALDVIAGVNPTAQQHPIDITLMLELPERNIPSPFAVAKLVDSMTAESVVFCKMEYPRYCRYYRNAVCTIFSHIRREAELKQRRATKKTKGYRLMKPAPSDGYVIRRR